MSFPLRASIVFSVLSLTVGACGGSDASPGDDAATTDSGSAPANDTAVAVVDARDAISDAPTDTTRDAPSDADAFDSAPLDTTPTSTPSGVSGLVSGVTTDEGVADGSTPLRALLGFPWRNQSAMLSAIGDIYDPTSASFRKYMSASDVLSTYAPTEADVDLVSSWLTAQGLTVARVTKNRLFLEITGTVAKFDAAFGTTLHTLQRKDPQQGNAAIEVLSVVSGGLTVPKYVADRIVGVITADLAADPTPLPGEIGSLTTTPPTGADAAFTPANIAKAYGLDTLASEGFTGGGARLGVVMGAAFKMLDVESFWKSWGISRSDPIVVQTMEPPATRYLESTIDCAWSAALAPGADVVVYQGPDSRNTSLVYTFAEAIAQADVDVITDSFAHREDSEPAAVRLAYDRAAMEAAALGITVVSASGDGGHQDIPSTSPFVTSVGGTVLSLDGSGAVASESAWSESGSGDSLTFDLPSWQSGAATGLTKRAVVDVSANAGAPYWVYYLGAWTSKWEGSSFASPVFAGGMTVLAGLRASKSMPRIGWLNALLYTTSALQKTFRDVTSGGTSSHAASTGWDYPTGWGAPQFHAMATAIP